MNEEFIKDIFSDLADDWHISIVENIWSCGTTPNQTISDTRENDTTLNKAIKNFWRLTKLKLNTDSESIECFKIMNIYFYKKSPLSVFSFKDFKEINLSLLGKIPVICDELDINDDDIKIDLNNNGYTISCIVEKVQIKNFKKLNEIQTNFNKKYNGLLSIGIYDDGIRLSVQGHTKNIQDLIFVRNRKDIYEQAIETLKNDFNIEYKDDYVYLHPKFEFII
jgi:hypothetical protein